MDFANELIDGKYLTIEDTQQFHDILSAIQMNKDDFGLMMKILREKADYCVLAQYYLGIMYIYCYTNGENDGKNGFDLILKSAVQGNKPAAYKIAKLYHRPTTAPLKAHEFADYQDSAMAEKWYKKTIEYGNLMGHLELGTLYYNGSGNIKQDYKLALEHWSQCTDEQSCQGLVYVGNMYELGVYVEKNLLTAYEIYKKVCQYSKCLGGSSLNRLLSNNEFIGFVREHPELDISLEKLQAKELNYPDKVMEADNPLLKIPEYIEFMKTTQWDLSDTCEVDREFIKKELLNAVNRYPIESIK